MVLLDWPYIGLPPYGCTIHFEEILSCFVLTVFLVKLSKRGSYLHNTNIWVIFYQNLGIWPPAIGVTLHCFANNFEEIPSWFVMNVCLWLLWMIKWVKLWSYLHSINIWDDLLSKYGYLTPRGYHTKGYSLLFCHSFLINPIMLCPECIFVVTLHVICIIPMGEVIFGQSLEYLTRGCPYIRLPPLFCD